MFEDYLQDAYHFYQLAEDKVNSGEEREAKMFYRATVFCAASSLEAFVNFIGDSFKQGNTLDKNEIAFLNDQIIEISPSKALLQEKTKYQSIENKIKFILIKFSVPIIPGSSPEWSKFMEFKKLRDSLVHSKSIDDENAISEYKSIIREGINANIDIMNAITHKLFSRPLRTKLRELKI